MRQSEGLKDKKKTKQKREREGEGGEVWPESTTSSCLMICTGSWGAGQRQTDKHFSPAPFSFSLFSPAPKNRLQRREGREKRQGEGQRRGGVLPWSPGRAWDGAAGGHSERGKHDGGRRRFHGRRVSFVLRAKQWKEFVGAGGGGGGVEADRGGGGGAQWRVQSQAAAAEKQMWWLSD